MEEIAMAKGTINSSTEHKYSIVCNFKDGSSLVMYQHPNSHVKNFIYINGFELSLSEFNLIKDTFGLPPRLGSKNKVTLNLDETGLIFELATPNAHLRRSTVTLDDTQRKVTSKISAFHAKTLRNIRHNVLTPDERSKMNSDQAWFRGKAQRLNQVIDQTFVDSQGIWKIKKVLGLGKSSVACSAKLIVPILGWFGPRTKVIKFTKPNKYNVFLDNVNVNEQKEDSPIENETLANIIHDVEKEQVMFNNAAGRKAQQVRGGGITEELVPGKRLSLFNMANLTQIKKRDALIKIMLATLKLHKKNMAHGDLNIENIMVDFNPKKQTISVKLIDFDRTQKLGYNQRLCTQIEEINSDNFHLEGNKIKRHDVKRITVENISHHQNDDIQKILEIAQYFEINLEQHAYDNSSELLFTWIKSLINDQTTMLSNGIPNIAKNNAQFSYDQNGILKQIRKHKPKDPDVISLIEMQNMLKKVTKPNILTSDKKLLLSASAITLLTLGTEGSLQLADSNFAISKNYVNAAVQLVAALGVIGFLAYAIQNLYAVKLAQRISDFDPLNTKFTQDFKSQVQQNPTKSELEFITPDPASKAAKILGLGGQTGEPRTTEVKRTLFPTT